MADVAHSSKAIEPRDLLKVCVQCGREASRPGQRLGKKCHTENERRRRQQEKDVASQQDHARRVLESVRWMPTSEVFVLSWDWKGKAYSLPKEEKG